MSRASHARSEDCRQETPRGTATAMKSKSGVTRQWLTGLLIVSTTAGCASHAPTSQAEATQASENTTTHNVADAPAASESTATITPAGETEARHPTGKAAAPRKRALKQVGVASWYGRNRKGKKTASGQPFDPNKLTAAHRTLPLGSKAKVTNLKTGESTEVTINDRGPYVRNRSIDLSSAAAKQIGITKQGVAPVKIEATPKPQPTGSPTPASGKESQ